ncbi:alpha-E domain-containing protein [Pseudomarimonas salicorniae]|uniref:Alpha-E domain-containing protein n=1 Tax=Pseudomarimonas salicorniae TaxID=2933270 RepID=A0ABT0GHA0_9GAMM|nr:alpha-E domain-containing protein [Lysobacter sp. CAU 1642]MCK7593917.1 alpha-E domain-containing protein [Lysobacter sp. CAU 1642]
MLARIASNLFWLSRYMERAGYLARLLQVAGQMSSLRPGDGGSSEWTSAIVAAGGRETFFPDREATEASVIDYLAFDPENPSSIVSCFETARRNARAVRVALTSEMWEAVNGTWLELRQFKRGGETDELLAFLDWVKARAGLFQGVYSNTMLRMDGFHFARLGQFLERADNTARLLDVKYHVELPQVEDVGGVLDYYQWLAILRVVAARRAYRVMFQGRVEPRHVAELLILRPEFPRSLRFCYQRITEHLDWIHDVDPVRAAEPKRAAHSLHVQLQYAQIDQVMQGGLHEYLSDIVDRTSDLGGSIARAYLF